MDVPAELKTGVERRDYDQRQAEIEMGRRPGLQRPPSTRHRALAKTEQGQPQDQQRSDRTKRITEPAPSLVARLDIGEGVDEQAPQRSEERRGGKECVSTCRSRGSPGQ